MTSQGARWARRIGGLVLGLSLLASFSPTASADDPPDADTGATVGGGSSAPTIECGFALNDVDHNWSSTPPMQYGQDDDAVAKPSPVPCTATANAATQADQAANLTPPIHITVKPNAHDEPTQQYVELWGAVTSSSTSTIVYWDVYHPDGTFKVQVDGKRYASSADAASQARCDGPVGMFDNVKATGQATDQAVTNIINECKFQQKSLWFGAFGLSKHQPYGTYKIVLHAANAGGSEVTLTYFIQVQSFYKLEKDFTNVQFGSVSANSHFWQSVQGDFVWDGVNNAANQATSVRNTGNAGIGLNVRFHSLCLTTAPSCTDDKRIDHFDVKYGKTLSGLQSLGAADLATALVSDLASTVKPAPAGPWYQFDGDINRVLCPNDVAKIEFSIWTENIQAGSYTAVPGIGLQARPAAICPTDLGHVYGTVTTPTSNTHWTV